MLYCWGENCFGQLGLGKPVDEEQRWEPVHFRPGPEVLSRRGVVQVACGECHTLLLHPDGGVSSCGINARGQLGRSVHPGEPRSAVPEPVQALETQNIIYISCGKEHSLAICSDGRVFSWGAGTFGQLGTGERKDRVIPKRLDALCTHQIIQVACGDYHSMALAKGGRVFSWGRNNYGQLGVGKEAPSRGGRPQSVSTLDGIPLAQVAAGGTHSFALSLSGVVYGWGNNSTFQLGIRERYTKEDTFTPYLVAALRNVDAVYISCGSDHTAVLTQNGHIFTFGNDATGQLGRNSCTKDTGPQMVDLPGRQFSLLECGSYHTLAYSSVSSELISFGCGFSQRGPTPAKKDGMPSFNISALIAPHGLLVVPIKQIFAGTYVNFAIIQASKDGGRVSSAEALPKISQLDRVMIAEWMTAEDIERRQKAEREIEEIFSFPSCLTASFLKPRSALKADSCIMVDLQKARDTFYELIQRDWIGNKIFLSVLNHLVHALPTESPHEEAFSCFLLVPECLEALEAKSQQTLGHAFAGAVSKLSKYSSELLEKHWLALPVAFFDRIVQMLKRAVVTLLPYCYAAPHFQELVPILETLQKLYEVNLVAAYKVRLSNFYIDKLSKRIDLFMDFSRWLAWVNRRTPSPEFSFCRFPFVFDLKSKQQLFHIDSFIMQQSIKLNAHQELFTTTLRPTVQHPTTPIFLLRVKRQDIVAHTLYILRHVEDATLKMELVVEFEGEPRHENNTAAVEFFFYLFDEMIRPDYGMFMYCEQNSPMWFPANPATDLMNYYLFGILFGLCLFNRVLAYVPFPLAVFKKLMGREPSLSDLKELSPILGKNLQFVLDYDHDDMEVNLQLTYRITWDNMAVDLIPNGFAVAVNPANRKDFVSRYIDYVFNKSVERVFGEFERGVYKVLNRRIVGFFQPQELMDVAVGHAKYDWKNYEQNAAYWGIYNMTHPTIKIFWKVFRGLTLAEKKGFLLFVTGSDRLPVKVKEDMHLKIYSNSAFSEDHLPEALACFQILLLPPYSTTEKLKEKLLKAIENNRGFGK